MTKLTRFWVVIDRDIEYPFIVQRIRWCGAPMPGGVTSRNKYPTVWVTSGPHDTHQAAVNSLKVILEDKEFEAWIDSYRNLQTPRSTHA